MSNRQEYTFEEFKEHFIDRPFAYYAVYSALEEDDNGNYLPFMLIDMICEWRLTDGSLSL